MKKQFVKTKGLHIAQQICRKPLLIWTTHPRGTNIREETHFDSKRFAKWIFPKWSLSFIMEESTVLYWKRIVVLSFSPLIQRTTIGQKACCAAVALSKAEKWKTHWTGKMNFLCTALWAGRTSPENIDCKLHTCSALAGKQWENYGEDDRPT